MHGEKATGWYVLLSSTGQYIVKVIVEKEKAVHLYLVAKKLPSWIVCHRLPYVVPPFQEACLRHGRFGSGSWKLVVCCLSDSNRYLLDVAFITWSTRVVIIRIR